MPMYRACPGSELWQKKMIWAARQCMASWALYGVLYDLGGLEPFFCYARNHTHKKPSQANESKARLFAELRRVVRSYGEDKVILMEHNVDIYGMSMDVAQGHATHPERRFMDPSSYKNPDAWKQDSTLREMYRYTFPELVMTNRECGEDENHYRAYAGYSFLLGLRFDMTIWRCCGSLKDIPNYAAYLKQLNAVSTEYAEFVQRGSLRRYRRLHRLRPLRAGQGLAQCEKRTGFHSVELHRPGPDYPHHRRRWPDDRGDRRP